MISRKPEQLFESESPSAPANRTSEIRGSYDDRLNHILEAATREIAQAGYQKASMRAVAKAAEVSLAGLYHYFDSKEKMLFLILFRAFNSLLSNLREKLHGVGDPLEQIRVMIRAHVSYFAANMAALKACSHELDSLTGDAYEETLEVRRQYYKLTRAIVERILEVHAPQGNVNRHVATMTLFGTLNWLYRWYDPKQGPSPALLANQITEQFLHGVIGASTMRTGSAASRDRH